MSVTWKQDKSDPLLYEKELLPVGRIVPFVNAKHDVATVNIEESYLDSIVENFKKCKKVGVRVPLFKTHVEDPDNERGVIVDVVKRNNKSGKPSTFAKVRFHNQAAAKRGTKVDVSVFCPPKFRDGKGNVYQGAAIQHVALTSRPVVPALEGWEGPVILSLDTPNGLMLADTTAATNGTTKKPNTNGVAMTELLDQIIEALGLSAPDGSDDMAKLRLILHDVSGAGDNAGGGGGAPGAGALNLAFPPALINQFKKSREVEIDGLVTEGTLTPARGAEWKKKFCAPEMLKCDLRLSSDVEEGGDESKIGETEFDRFVAEARTLAKDKASLKPQGRTVLKLSAADDDDDESKDSATVRAAKKLAKQSKTA